MRVPAALAGRADRAWRVRRLVKLISVQQMSPQVGT